jgi:hypothetical protein
MESRRSLIVLLPVLVAWGFVAISRSQTDTHWIPLFNGKNMDGWYTYTYLDRGNPKEDGKNNDHRQIFRVDGGMIHILGVPDTGQKVPYGYLATNTQYSDVRIHAEYKYGVKRFAGYYSSTAESPRNSGLIYLMTGSNESPLAAECQIEESNTGDLELWGTSAMSNVINTGYPAYDIDAPPHQLGPGSAPRYENVVTRIVKFGAFENLNEWNTLEVILVGSRATQIVNGRIINAVWNVSRPDPQHPSTMTPITKGHIALQEEGAEIWFRNVKVRPLTASEKQAPE